MKGAACTVTCSYIAYVTSGDGRVSEIRHRQSSFRRDITPHANILVLNTIRNLK